VGPGVRIAVIRSVLGAAAFFLTFSLSAVAPGRAQSPPPLPGFVPPYEITRIVRTAGFDPLAPPLREGTTYVIRATDFRGILMRVVVDARSGAIRAVNRIVSDQGMYGAVGMLPPPYGVPAPYGLSPSYGAPSAYVPPEFEVPDIAPSEEASVPTAPVAVAVHPVARPLVFEPPLPRPRPAALAARRTSDDAKPAADPPVVTAAPALKKPSPIQLPD
jgi:hypothetical protein